MAEYRTVQQAVIGEVLPDIGVRSRAMIGVPGSRHSGARHSGDMAGLSKNLHYVPQSVVKRVTAGGCHSAKELRRQMDYVTRDEANVASWSNQIGIERSFDERCIDSVVADWTSSWAGSPRRGHTDHIILSFPKGTAAGLAEQIARDWGQEVFGSGFYEDRFRYVAAMHHNTQHVHCHFIVDKVGMDQGRFLSISRFSEINYEMLRMLHADIAKDYGLALNTTPRFSRGLVENAPRETDIQAARQHGREPYAAPLSFVERARREAMVRGYVSQYRELAQIAAIGQGFETDGYLAQIMARATAAVTHILEGDFKMARFESINEVPSGSVDPAGRLLAAREALIAEAKTAWENIQAMEPGAERVYLEGQFAAQGRAAAHLVVGNDFMTRHAQSVSTVDDTYHVASIMGLHDRAQEENGRFTALADAGLEEFRDRLQRSFAPQADRFEEAGTSVAEMAARFASRDRTEAQIEAWRPVEPAERENWVQFERDLQREAESIAVSLPVGRALQEDLAREALLSSRPTDRLADIAALDKLVTEVRADLSDGDMDRIARGQLDPLMDQIRDPGLRSAVGSELRNLAAVEDRGHISGRDSDSADRYRDLVIGHERSAARAKTAHGRDSVDHELDL